MIDKIKAYFGIGLATIFAVLLAVQSVRLHNEQMESAEIRIALANEKSLAAAAWVISTTTARETEQNLNGSAAVTRKETNEQVRTLTNQRDALLKRVRLAESKAAGVAGVPPTPTASSTGGTSSGSHGSELLGTLGEQDVEEALRGDTIRLQLAACYWQYNKAREALSK